MAFLLLFLAIIIGYIYWNIQQKKDNEIYCGGLGGVDCPSGYYCRMITFSKRDVDSVPLSRWDAGGVCKKINSNKAADCLSTKDTGILCIEYK